MAYSNSNKAKAYQQKWAAANRDKVLAKAKRYRDKWRTKVRIENRIARALWRANNRELHRSQVKSWAKRNPQKATLQSKRKRARKLNAKGFHTLEQWMARVEVFGWKCVYCKLTLTLLTLTKDHKIPLSRGGSEWPSNLVPACRVCNSTKHTSTYISYINWLKTGSN